MKYSGRKYKVTTRAVRKANDSLVSRGLDNSVRSKYSGVVTVKHAYNGIEKKREISKEALNLAYKKSLVDYAQKL